MQKKGKKKEKEYQKKQHFILEILVLWNLNPPKGGYDYEHGTVQYFKTVGG